MKTICITGHNVQINENGTAIYVDGKTNNIYLIKDPKKHKRGFKATCIDRKQYYVHKLVAEAYVHNPHPLTYKNVAHKDNNSLNNNYSNLMWGTKKTIHKYKKEKGLYQQSNPRYRGQSQISYYQALRIAVRLKHGETAISLAKEYGVSDMSISRIRKRYGRVKNVGIRYSDDDKNNVIKLLQNHNIKTVSRITGINYVTIWKWKHDFIRQTTPQ